MFGTRSILAHINDSVVQSAGFAHDGNGAVLKAVHLIQAARFKLRWHQKEVATGLDSVREPGFELNLYDRLRRKSARQFRERPFKFRIARPKHHELQIGAQHFLKRAQHNIDPFLFHQTADAAEQRNCNIGGQAEFRLQVELVSEFAFEILSVKRVFLGA